MSVAWTERGVPAPLRPWIASVWELRAGPQGGVNRVVPDGSVDLVWHAGRVEIAGANSVAFTATMRPGDHAAGVRLHPGAAPPLLGASGASLRDQARGAHGALGLGGWGARRARR